MVDPGEKLRDDFWKEGFKEGSFGWSKGFEDECGGVHGLANHGSLRVAFDADADAEEVFGAELPYDIFNTVVTGGSRSERFANLSERYVDVIVDNSYVSRFDFVEMRNCLYRRT